jgi:exonuclease III
MLDSFRELHGEKRKFSRKAVMTLEKNQTKINKHILTRIDHILISENLLNNLTEARIHDNQILDSDHRMVTIKIKAHKKKQS